MKNKKLNKFIPIKIIILEINILKKMLGNALKKLQTTINAGITGVKTFVNTLNENRPLLVINQKKYYQDKLIAEGGYALIFKIQALENEKEYALKRISIQSQSHLKQIKREIKYWKELSKYENIVEMKDFEFTQRNAYIVMELCTEGSLMDFVNNYEGLIPEEIALKIMNQILIGLYSMHSQNPPIAHRDLKIENILKFGKSFKICDFGSCSNEVFDPVKSDEFMIEENFSNFEKNSTLYYRAPEMCDKYGKHIVNEKVDIWSLGCVLYTMVFKEQPFINAQKLEIISGQYNFPRNEQKNYSEKFLDLIRILLTPNPEKRPSVIEVMQWTNYWKKVEKIELSDEVLEIKRKQIETGGVLSRNEGGKKKLLSVEEIKKIQKRLKKKEQMEKNKERENKEEEGLSSNKGSNIQQNSSQKNVDLLFGFSSGENENNTKSENNNKEVNLLDLGIFGGTSPGPNTNNNNINQKEQNKENNDLLDMQFYAVEEGNGEKKQSFDNSGALHDLFGDLQGIKVENEKKLNEQTQNILNGAPVMNGQDFFSGFTNNVEKKDETKNEEIKPSSTSDDLFAAFGQAPNTSQANKENNQTKKEGKTNNNNSNLLFNDLFNLGSTTNNPKKEDKNENNGNTLNFDLFSAVSRKEQKREENKVFQDENSKKEETSKSTTQFDLFNIGFQAENKKESKEEKNRNLGLDLFESLGGESSSQNQNNDQKEEIKQKENPVNNQNIFDILSQNISQKNEKSEESKKGEQTPSNTNFDLFNFESKPKAEEPKQEKKIENNTNIDLSIFNNFNNETKNDEKTKEVKSDSKPSTSNDISDIFQFSTSSANENGDTSKKENDKPNGQILRKESGASVDSNKNQDILGFFS